MQYAKSSDESLPMPSGGRIVIVMLKEFFSFFFEFFSLAWTLCNLTYTQVPNGIDSSIQGQNVLDLTA